MLFMAALGAAAPAQGADINREAYPFAYMLTSEEASTLPMEEVPRMMLGETSVNPRECYFTPELDLSGMSKPVLRLWSIGSSGSFNPNGDYTALRHGSRYRAISGSNGYPTIAALPAIDRLSVGKTLRLGDGEILTVGELPANREDITITDFAKRIVKGTDTGERISPAESAAGAYSEAEAVFTAERLSSLTQGALIVRMDTEIQPVDELPEEVGEPVFTCAATTPAGEVPLARFGTDYYQYSGSVLAYYLLPDNTTAVTLRWRFPAGMDSGASTGNWMPGEGTNFCQAVQAGYGEEPTLGFDLSLLTGEYAGVTSSDAVTLADSQTFDSNAAYDLDGDGIKEYVAWSSQTYRYNLLKFKPGMAGVEIAEANFGEILSFSRGTSATGILGYDKGEIFSVGADMVRTTLYTATSPRFALIDYDNDGRPDFLNAADNTVVSFDAEGTAARQTLLTMTMDDYLGILPPGPNPLGSGLSFITDPGTPPAVFASYSQTDINGDGYPDFVDAASGNYYMNLGDGRFVTDSFRGTLLFRDFDGDGVNDFILYDSRAKTVTLYLQRIGGENVSRRLFSGMNCGRDIWCRDFDKDGDIDILIPFNASENDGMAFLVMLENNGSGTFKKKEYPIDGAVDFRYCTDWNSDGKYEVITDMEIDRATYGRAVGRVASYAVDGLMVTTEPEYIICDHYKYNNYGAGTKVPILEIADLDNTGHTRFILDGLMMTPEAPANSAPTTPASPSLAFDAESGELTVTWERGSDRETAAADLTYELRVGTTPGGDDIVSANATAGGSRRDLVEGSCGHTLKRKFNTATWPKGDIYVSVQSVDASGLGSAFSAPATFKKSNATAEFAIDAPEGVAVYEEVTLKITSPLEAGAIVTWELEGGELIGEPGTEIAGTAKARFLTPGTNSVRVTVSDADGGVATATREVTIAPIRFESLDDLNTDFALDLDLDGTMEIHEDKFLEGDAAGNYSEIRGIFNTKYYWGLTGADINRDGLADIIHYDGHLLNAGDKTMDDGTPEGFSHFTYLPDLDNDGAREALDSDGYLYRNSGDYAGFANTGEAPWRHHKVIQYYDYDGDGLTDVLSFSDSYTPAWYRNKGEMSFEVLEIPTHETYGGAHLAGDFDGDGLTDYLYSDGNYNFFAVVWNDGSATPIGSFDKYYYKGIYNPMTDFDNNGCMDLVIYDSYNDGTGGYTAVLFNADHSFTTIEGKYVGGTEHPYLRTDGSLGLGSAIVRCAPNEKPSAPAGVTAEVSGSRLVISWEAAADRETPAASMRYNLSVRRKGAEGEGAYLISPLNGGVNGVSAPNDTYFIRGTRYEIPLMTVPQGEYEVKVQAVDGRSLTGDFSEPVFVTVAAAGYDAPEETMAGETVAITFNADTDLSKADFGEGAVVESTIGQTAYVHWTTAGVKTITAPGLSFTILVHEALDASFTLPAKIAEGATVHIACDNGHQGQWFLSRKRPSWSMNDPFYEYEAETIDEHTVALTFPTYSGEYTVRHIVTAPYGSATYETETKVSGSGNAEIGIVDIDDATGKYRVHAGTAAEDVTEFMLYRETSTYNEYEYLGTLAVAGSYLDSGSNPREHTSRYVLRNSYWYGESPYGTPHQPIHAIISKGINNEWNISWNKYEGRNATTYRVLRGASPSALECIAEVSGNTTSYSDYSAPASTQYYAVETLIDKPAVSRAGAGQWRSRSNTVSTDTSGLDSVVSENDQPRDVYSLQGICLRRAASRADIEALPAGIYIIGGEKVVIN